MAKKKIVGEDGNTYVAKIKKPFYKRVWFWILALIVIAAFSSGLGGKDKKDTTSASKESTQSTSKESTQSTSKESTQSTSKESAKETEKKSSANELKENYDKIALGDLMTAGEGGSSLDEVKAIFGEPSSTSETNISGQSTKMLTWSGVKGGDFLSSIVVSFSSDKAVSKAVTGLKVAKHDKATLEQFNAVATDGSYTIDTAKQTFGEPDSISETLISGQKQEMLSWTKHINGDLGANMNITFDDGKATNKAQFSMK